MTNTEEEVSELVDKIDEFEHYLNAKSNINLIFIGHVDVGKSTLCGHLLVLSGLVDKRMLEKYKNEAESTNRSSWLYAFIFDIDSDERERGKTIEVGSSFFETERNRFNVLDAPGHKNYVQNMIEAAAYADFAILVVSARKGEFEAGFQKQGQTREHLLIACAFGLSKIIVVINKMDDITVEWSKERYDYICAEILKYIKQLGYSKSDIYFLPLSAFKGLNLNAPIDRSLVPWLDENEPYLLQILDAINLERDNDESKTVCSILSLSNDNIYSFYGKVERGSLRVNSSYNLTMCSNLVEVSKIFVMNQSVNYADHGEIVMVKLKGISDDFLRKGYVLYSPESPIHSSRLLKVKIQLLDLPERKPIFSNNYQFVLHIGTSEVTAILLKILERSFYDKSKKQRIKIENPKYALKGDRLFCIIKCTDSYVPVEKYDIFSSLGRVIFRDLDKTIAIGKVSDYKKE